MRIYAVPLFPAIILTNRNANTNSTFIRSGIDGIILDVYGQEHAMKIAIPVWDNHVSTVLDFSDSLIIVDYDSGSMGARYGAPFGGSSIIQRVSRLKELGVNVLLCGAVSGPLERMILASGIAVIPFLRGTIDEVLEAYLHDRLVDERFALPGCYPARMGYGRRGMGRRGRRGGWGKRRGEWL